MTRAAGSLDSPVRGTKRSDAARSLMAALAVLGVGSLVAACADAGNDRRGAPSGGAAASQQGAGVASGAAGGAPGGTIGGAGTPAGATARPGTTGGGDAGTPVTPDSASKVPPTTR